MPLLSFDNPVFVTFALAAGVMVLKAVAMSWLTVVRMLWFKSGFRSPAHSTSQVSGIRKTRTSVAVMVPAAREDVRDQPLLPCLPDTP